MIDEDEAEAMVEEFVKRPPASFESLLTPDLAEKVQTKFKKVKVPTQEELESLNEALKTQIKAVDDKVAEIRGTNGTKVDSSLASVEEILGTDLGSITSMISTPSKSVKTSLGDSLLRLQRTLEVTENLCKSLERSETSVRGVKASLNEFNNNNNRCDI